MKYDVELNRTETKTVTVFASSPELAAEKSANDGFIPTGVEENLGPDEIGESWPVNGRCEGCSAVLFEEYRVDQEGIEFCVKCFDEMVAAEDGCAT